jgi:hypothetical protein
MCCVTHRSSPRCAIGVSLASALSARKVNLNTIITHAYMRAHTPVLCARREHAIGLVRATSREIVDQHAAVSVRSQRHKRCRRVRAVSHTQCSIGASNETLCASACSRTHANTAPAQLLPLHTRTRTSSLSRSQAHKCTVSCRAVDLASEIQSAHALGLQRRPLTRATGDHKTITITMTTSHTQRACSH